MKAKAKDSEGRKRVIVEAVSPEIDGGRFPTKRTVGDQVSVEADIFADGHDAISASLLAHREGSDQWTEIPMRPLVNDRWTGTFRVAELGRYGFKVQGWIDHFETWRRDLLKRIKAEADTAIDYLMGADLIAQAAERATGADADWLRHRATVLRSKQQPRELRTHATDPTLQELVRRYPDKRFATFSDREIIVMVDPLRARFSSWYEFFPRSTSPEAGRHGTFTDSIARLPYIAEMGFNVVYLPPVHPIGQTFRKGRNNSPSAEAGDPGSPWAIGSEEGGHKGVHPQLGTIDDFRRFVKEAKDLNLSVALDIAFQASPDHPYVRKHESWFRKRPDGSIQYAENPPKKYQDIYPFEFESQDWAAMWEELKSVFLYWIDQGVTIFRVDNPHTKAFPFWEWVIAEIRRDHPEVLFLAEAFTRPKVMYRLAKLGFSQSYTYFPWRNAKSEITSYLTELTQPPIRDFFRPNHWPNTPDILTEFLQIGGRAVFSIRLLLAATLGANYGIYGPAFELLEHRALRQGSEEYLDSEKYEIRGWDIEQPTSLRHLIARVNTVRNENEALQNDWSLKFHLVDNDQIIGYSKESDDHSNLMVMVVNLDPHHTQSGYLTLPLDILEIPPDRAYEAEDLLTGARYLWHGSRNYVELNPTALSGHILKIHRRMKVESDFEYFL
ncbi:MAG: alpha-1,4-glucan--maltose-1-phosphate maltosyltransferase [Acidobacteria bacterium]|nr:alpha-1,4-glucan--maltose-1-phosphate maltosyltransferase [Acidobacteriota bacterium]MBV9623646.1 alpha-1,4-glucan--maltose-1-phosphate maltosyltransferase [Acidobacteriota bacterium]